MGGEESFLLVGKNNNDDDNDNNTCHSPSVMPNTTLTEMRLTCLVAHNITVKKNKPWLCCLPKNRFVAPAYNKTIKITVQFLFLEVQEISMHLFH